jgi:hypothetical protein
MFKSSPVPDELMEERILLQMALFGSHFALFHLESGILKMYAAGPSGADCHAIWDRSAHQLLNARARRG